MNFECKYPKQKFFAIIKDIDIKLLLKEEFEDLAEKSPLNNYGNYLRVLAKDNNVNS